MDLTFDITGEENALAMDRGGNIYADSRRHMAVITFGKYVLINDIANWNRSRSDSLGSGVDGCIFALTFDECRNLFAGGSFLKAGNSSAKNIARWDGNVWSAVGSGTDGTVRARFYRDSSIYIDGQFLVAGGRVSPCIARRCLNAPGNPVIKDFEYIYNQMLFFFRKINSTICFENIRPKNEISLYSLLGKFLLKTLGTESISLTKLSQKYVVVCIVREKKLISRGVNLLL